jgi:hypothetical protein
MSDPKHRHLNLEPGEYTLSGQDVILKIGTTSALSNTAILALDAFQSPLSTTVVVSPGVHSYDEVASDSATKTGGPGFKLALVAVIFITGICLVAMMIMAVALPDPADAVQTKVLDTVTNVFVAGIGTFIGLIWGKAT